MIANAESSSAPGAAAQTLERLERRYERLAQIGTPAIAAIALGFAGVAIFGGHGQNFALFAAAGCVIALAVGYFLATMTSLRREIARRRLPTRAERMALMRRVGELSAVIDASREIEAAKDVTALCERLAIEAESLAASDAALVVLLRKGRLEIAAATDPVDRDDAALAAQAPSWAPFLEDGGMPYLATQRAMVREGFGSGPLADRYEFAMQVPLAANGRTLGLLVVLRRDGADGFDADGLMALGLLADVASHLVLLKRMNARVRRTNRRLVASMRQLNRAQGQLVQSERLRAVGQLVSGVAHEISNPLTSLLGFSQLLGMHPGLPGEQRRWIDEIQREASRCSVILRNLLSFARASASGEGAATPSAVVAETLSLKAYDVRKAGVEVVTNVPDTLGRPAIDRQELQQILLNLITNAIAAMRDARIRRLCISARETGAGIEISVEDSGCGIAPEDHERVFEPFYTTKKAGDAVGLGLTTCRKILEERGGSISVRSAVGSGSTFTVTIPRAPEPVAQAGLIPSSSRSRP